MKDTDRVYLREWRLAKGLTQPELAKRVGTVKSEISRLEKGTRRMTMDWMSALSKAMSISPEDLMSLPPIGFGAVSPAPKPPDAMKQAQDFETIHFGGMTLGIGGNGFAVTTITGDDWAGTFTPGDLLIYDTAKKSTSVPGLFALEIGGETMTRRVVPSKNGLVLTCANESYPDMPMDAEFNVLGRVVARVHRI